MVDVTGVLVLDDVTGVPVYDDKGAVVVVAQVVVVAEAVVKCVENKNSSRSRNVGISNGNSSREICVERRKKNSNNGKESKSSDGEMVGAKSVESVESEC